MRSWLAVLPLASLLACAPPATPRGVVLVVIDALRADHVSAYGYERSTSPNIDALAADGTRFDQAISSAPWTLPALATLMTSLQPSQHRAMHHSNTDAWSTDREHFRPVSALAEYHTTLAEVLSLHGVSTAAFVRGSYPAAVFGFAQGFDRFSDNEVSGLRWNVEAVLQWLDEPGRDRFFVYLHTIEVHSPYSMLRVDKHVAAALDPRQREILESQTAEEQDLYRSLDPDPEYRGPINGSYRNLQKLHRSDKPLAGRDRDRLLSLYDRGIRYTDHYIGKLIEGLRERGLYDSTLWIVTSDHGDEFFEHGGLEHGQSYYEEVLRIPLVVRHPSEGHGRVVAPAVGLIDLMPTVLDALGIHPPAKMAGRSLMPQLRGEVLASRPVLAQASERGGVALRGDDFKFVALAGGELYDLRADPDERHNLCRSEPLRCASLDDEVHALSQSSDPPLLPPKPVELDAVTRDRLRALGYAEPPSP